MTDRSQISKVAPVQLCRPRVTIPESERRLRLAVLEDAVRYYCTDVATADARARMLHDDAAEWFASDDHDEPFAFENVCDALGLDPDAVRRELRRRRAALAAPHRAAA
jgi:hypothetical protein